MANYIADATVGDLLELQPAEPYTDDDLNWTDDNRRVTREHEDESLRDVELVSTTVENWDSYDTVFIGDPDLVGHRCMAGKYIRYRRNTVYEGSELSSGNSGTYQASDNGDCRNWKISANRAAQSFNPASFAKTLVMLIAE